VGHVRIKIIVPNGGDKIAAALRDQGYLVTQTLGTGRQGVVTLLHSIIERQQTQHLIGLVENINPRAFITIEEQTVYQRLLDTARKIG
jgi:uncharacterized protein YebE (UPF0316 family)